MATKARKRDGKGRYKSNTAAAPARKRTYRRKRNPKQYRRRNNPGALTKSALYGHGAALLSGGIVGAVSGGMDKVLDPALIAVGWKRGLIDLLGGVVLGGVAAVAGMPSVAHGCMAGGGALAALRIVNDVGDPKAIKARAQAVLDRQVAKEAAALGSGAPAAAGNPYMITAAPRTRLLPPGMPTAGTGVPLATAVRVAR